MKTYFDRKIILDVQKHAQIEHPKEACGFIMDDYYHPIQNRAEDPINDFKISPEDFIKYRKEIRAIVHSHVDYPHLSKADMISQKKSGIPWGVTLLNKTAVIDTYFWGDDLEIQEFIGRPFVHGLYDCYALVRDYHRSIGHDVPDFPRSNLWWHDEPSMLEDNCDEAGFYYIQESEVDVGDVITMKVLADVTNHQAIYLGDGLMMHHLYNRLSRREPVHRWSKHITGFMRYKSARKES